ncbi:MAG: hypothetical protein ACO3F2_12000 [Roseiflexaceae bacterium]|jgi:hypothetical protein
MMSDFPAYCTPLAQVIGQRSQLGIQPSPRTAFVLDKPMRDRIVLLDPTLAPLFRRYVHNDDIHRYGVDDQQRFLLALPAGWTTTLCGSNAQSTIAWQCIADHYPALARHLSLFVADRPHHHIWWELDADVQLPNRTQQTLTWHTRKNHTSFALTPQGFVTATPWLVDPPVWLVGYLNSTPLQRWLNRQKVKGNGLAHTVIDHIPVPDALNEFDTLTELTVHAAELQKQRLQCINETVHTLVRNFAPLGATANSALWSWYTLDFVGLRKALVKSFKNDIPERLQPQWHTWLNQCQSEYDRIEQQLSHHEGRISHLVATRFPPSKGIH